jgi:hypothetical protein
VLYKLGDAFAGSLMTPFLLKSMAYASAEVGVVNKVIGLWLTIGGALLGGALMLRLGLWRSLMLFGVLQMASNLGFWWLAMSAARAAAGAGVAGLRLGLREAGPPTPVDGGLLMVVAFENLSGGMGTAAFVAFLMSLCTSASPPRSTRCSAPLPRWAGSGWGRWPACWPRASAGPPSSSCQHRAGAAGAGDAVVAARGGAPAEVVPGAPVD